MKFLKSSISLAVLSASCLLAAPLSVQAEGFTDGVRAAIEGGDANIKLRYRYEYVDKKIQKEGYASTLKSTLNYKTLPYQGFSGFVEFDNVSIIDDETNHFGGARAGTGDFEYTEVNQAYITYQNAGTTVRVGNQRINLDNQRFIGGVGWRQNEQTYDAALIQNTSIDNLTLSYAYVQNVNTFRGTNLSTHTNVFNAAYNLTNDIKLVGYYYDINQVSETVGLRATAKLNDMFSGELEYAQQNEEDAGDFSTDYIHAVLKVKPVKKITAILGYESFGSDDGNAGFSTTLGTNHAFNGFADNFIAGAPYAKPNGVNDAYVMLAGQLPLGIKAKVFYHDLSADNGTASYEGSEVDVVLVKPLSKKTKAVIKIAQFSGDDSNNDVEKAIFQIQTSF